MLNAINNVLAIDLGTHTGWCLNHGNELIVGTKRLATEKELAVSRHIRMDRRCDPRVPGFREWAAGMVNSYQVNVVVFEDVEFSVSRLQTQLWASLRGALWTVPRVDFECLTVPALKKFATGDGCANKDSMRRAFERFNFAPFKRPENDVDDNAIDATFLWIWATTNLRVRI